jgi:hypothetical protein
MEPWKSVEHELGFAHRHYYLGEISLTHLNKLAAVQVCEDTCCFNGIRAT